MKSSPAAVSWPVPVSTPSAIRVKALCERDRRALLMHFLALDADDRRLRFAADASDDTLTRYVQKIDFSRAAVFGVFDTQLALVGVGHLSFTPTGKFGVAQTDALPTRSAEFCLSVSVAARAAGIGGKLFERAVLHCRNTGIEILTMHDLASNPSLLHIASQAGLEIHQDPCSAQTYLRLAPLADRSDAALGCDSKFRPHHSSSQRAQNAD